MSRYVSVSMAETQMTAFAKWPYSKKYEEKIMKKLDIIKRHG